MKKKISSILVFIFILNLLIIPGKISFSAPHELLELNIMTFIYEDGSARITENRISNLSEGTENYIVIENLGDSEVIDFKVSEGNIVYDFQDDWNINASREQKTFKNGIIYTENGYELAWGIGEYGAHDVVLEYTVTNFVKNFQETQGVLWRFVNDATNIPPQSVSLVIESEQDFYDENANIWTFGYEGSIDFEENKVIAKSSSPFNSYDYLTVLLELDEPLFMTNSYVDIPFEDVKDMAFKGSDYATNDDYYNEYNNNYHEENHSTGGFGFLPFLLPFLLPFTFIFAALFFKNSSTSINRSRKLKRKFKEEYYRDYPYEGNFEDSFYILNNMGATSPETLITAFILKWINLEFIDIRKEQVGFLFKKEETSFKFLKTSIEGTPVERELYSMMRQAAGSNEILENNEFSRWSKNHYTEFQNWENKAHSDSHKKMESLGYLEMQPYKVLFFTRHKLVLTQKGQELEDNIYKFINYLHDFSILNEREAINVTLWDNLMIWAGLLGITEVVNKEFKKLYPQYEVESHYRGNGVHTAYIFANSATRSSAAAASAARSRGGGGFSSGGGGGGSFGGGSGGGTR